MSGLSPCVIIKSASTNPEIMPLEVGGTKSFSNIQSQDNFRTFLYVDDQVRESILRDVIVANTPRVASNRPSCPQIALISLDGDPRKSSLAKR